MERYQPQLKETETAKGTAVREKFMAVLRIPVVKWLDMIAQRLQAK